MASAAGGERVTAPSIDALRLMEENDRHRSVAPRSAQTQRLSMAPSMASALPSTSRMCWSPPWQRTRSSFLTTSAVTRANLPRCDPCYRTAFARRPALQHGSLSDREGLRQAQTATPSGGASRGRGKLAEVGELLDLSSKQEYANYITQAMFAYRNIILSDYEVGCSPTATRATLRRPLTLTGTSPSTIVR
ncbi:hypothetical protein ACVILL_001011 [Bradyrhizobium sp. USDA 3364]